MNFTNLYKNLQRKYYDLHLPKFSIVSLITFLIFIFMACITFYNVIEIFILWKSGRIKPILGYYPDNISGKSFQDKLCQASPIDVVYTWVNGSDPLFLQQLEEAMEAVSDQSAANDTTASRFRDKGELRYSLRSLEKFAPWVRHVYIVTNGQIPNWLNLDSPVVTIVTHEEIFPEKSHLPTFSSPAIEAHLHRIPGLSDTFLYFNDDVFLGKEIWPEDFFTLSKGHKIFLAWTIPQCSRECQWVWIGDGTCDPACNTERCTFDNGDCQGSKPQLYPKHEGQSAPKSARLEENNKTDSDTGDDMHIVYKMYKEIKKVRTKRKLLSLDKREGMRRPHKLKIKEIIAPTNQTILSHEKLYPNKEVKSPDVKQLIFNLMNSTNISLSDAVQMSNTKYIESKKAQRLSKKKGFKFRKKVPLRRFADQPLNDFENIEVRVNLSNNSSIKANNENITWDEQHLTSEGHEDHMDMFGESLLYVNSLYNREFGVQIRKVPAHMPHMLNKDILKALQARFPNEWNQTSYHRLRHKTDMQLAFSYYYYIMSLTINKTTGEIFDEFDTDKSGTWSDNEIRTVLTLLNGPHLTLQEVIEFEEIIKNCSTAPGYIEIATSAPNDRYPGSILPPITKKLVESCGSLVELLKDEFALKKVFKYEVVYEKDQDGVFKGLVNNLEKVLETLDGIRANRKKFICINDNIMPKSNANESSEEDIIVAVLQEFYHSLFPMPSTFELPYTMKNKFLYVKDYVSWQQKRSRFRTFVTIFFIVCFCLCVYIQLNYEGNPRIFKSIRLVPASSKGNYERTTRDVINI